jgi:hypothetical protein
MAKVKKIAKSSPRKNGGSGLSVQLAKLCGLGFSRAEYNRQQKALKKKR